VPTAEVSIAAAVGVPLAALPPQALNARLPTAAAMIKMVHFPGYFMDSYSFH
jgi:hypothetical protein